MELKPYITALSPQPNISPVFPKHRFSKTWSPVDGPRHPTPWHTSENHRLDTAHGFNMFWCEQQSGGRFHCLKLRSVRTLMQIYCKEQDLDLHECTYCTILTLIVNMCWIKCTKESHKSKRFIMIIQTLRTWFGIIIFIQFRPNVQVYVQNHLQNKCTE